MNDYLLNTPSKDKWQRIGTKKRSGVLVPLFSIFSHRSLGIGDFNDLKLITDWCRKTGNSIIQLLPLNEMGTVFCPYDALSSFALEPAYFAFDLLPAEDIKVIREELEETRKLFRPGNAFVDYRIKQEKLHLLRDIFDKRSAAYGAAVDEFSKENAYWLDDFVLYKALKNSYQGLPWYEWPEQFKNRDKKSLESFKNDNAEDINFQVWLQYELYRQLGQVKEFAAQKGILIKGDLPILVSRDSADVWAHPHFFKLEYAAGAPPDMYCAKGQRWGMPPYNWDNIAKDNYRYLKEKLQYASNFYHMLRIDHVVGLFRIWSIPYNEPLENQGLNGFFDPRDEAVWGEHGRSILSVMLSNTDMLLCAEDLGVIPRACTDTLRELGIPGNDVQRWVKDWNKRHDFLMQPQYRSISVTMLSTHDTTNWCAWWKYEAGTVDEALFVRKCEERGINYVVVRDRLFDLDLSYHGRLRWLNSVNSVDKLVATLGKRREEIGDFIDIYLNTFQEKEKLWQILKMPGLMQEGASLELVQKILKFNSDSASLFCIQLITDWLFLAGIFKGDPYQYRINTPGIISPKNWSMTVPISLDDLVKHRVCGEIKKMVVEAGRI